MKNLLLMTILIGTIACGGSGGGSITVDPETKQLVQIREVWKHKLADCEAIEETPTLRIECVNKGLLPLTEDWLAITTSEHLPTMKLQDGILKYKLDNLNTNTGWNIASVTNKIDFVSETFTVVLPVPSHALITWITGEYTTDGTSTSAYIEGILERDDETGIITMIPTSFDLITNKPGNVYETIKTINDIADGKLPVWILE